MPHPIKYLDFFSFLSPHLQREVAFLKKLFAPYTDKVYIVGGAVRDILRNIFHNEKNEIYDLDIEVYKITQKNFETLMKKIGAKGVGKSFFVYKYKNFIDISLPRTEIKTGYGHTGFCVKLSENEKVASLRRDFKMNAIMINVYTKEILDFWGGISDIKSKKISIIKKESFIEDSLRVLRGIQFSCRFGYKIENESVKVMKKISLNDLSKERIFMEFEKLFKGKYLHFGLYYLIKTGVFKKIFDICVRKEEFSRIAKIFIKYSSSFMEELREYEFIYITASVLKKEYSYFLDALQPPKRYQLIFKFQKPFNENIDEKFLLEVALNIPISKWLGNFVDDTRTKAEKLGIWEKKLQIVSAKKLLKEGFKGIEIAKEIRKRNIEFIKTFKSKK